MYRWFLKLAHDGYDYKVIHHPGKEHGNADALSQLMCTWDRSETLEGETITLTVEEETLTTPIKDPCRDHNKTLVSETATLTVEEKIDKESSV